MSYLKGIHCEALNGTSKNSVNRENSSIAATTNCVIENLVNCDLLGELCSISRESVVCVSLKLADMKNI